MRMADIDDWKDAMERAEMAQDDAVAAAERRLWLEVLGLVELERNTAISEGCEQCVTVANRILSRLRAAADSSK